MTRAWSSSRVRRAWPRSCSRSACRLANRVRQQLWRYYPQLLALNEDVTVEWILALWTMAPTPAKAARLRETTVARLLGRHRIRRLDAASVLDVLRQPAITVAAGVTEAAVLHLRSLVARLRLANTEFHQAEQKLDEFMCAEPGCGSGEHDLCEQDPALPGRTIVSQTATGQAIRSRAGITPPCGPSRVWRR